MLLGYMGRPSPVSLYSNSFPRLQMNVSENLLHWCITECYRDIMNIDTFFPLHPSQHPRRLLLAAIDCHSSFQRSKLLVNPTTRRTRRFHEHQLSTERPTLGNVPTISSISADHRVEMLKIAPESLVGKSRPCDKLIHALRMFTPCLPD